MRSVSQPRPSWRGRAARLGLLLTVLGSALGFVAAAGPASADSFVPISGAGSTWAQNALDQWIRDVDQFGIKVNYAGTGSADGRNQFANDTVDFATTEIPYGTTDSGVTSPLPTRGFAYLPLVGGGTSFMYNLRVGTTRITNLRLSPAVIAGIFTGTITNWDDPSIAADNPGLPLPSLKVTPVVRTDESGTTWTLTQWFAHEAPSAWDAYCIKARNVPCGGPTSTYPIVPNSGFVGQSGSLGVAGYVAQDQSLGAITYVENSYALNIGFPTANVLNAGGYYVAPNANDVSIALRGASIDTTPGNDYLVADLTGVFTNPDPRAYPLSSYGYMVVPTATDGTFSSAKGATLASFAFNDVCSGQAEAPVLGYAGLPKNLVLAGLDQIQRIPGADAATLTAANCDNPVLSATSDPLDSVPNPPTCDQFGQPVCGTVSPPPLSAIDKRYLALGAENSFLGVPLGDETDTAGGRVRHYVNGDIYWSSATGAFEVHGPILARFLQLGGSGSVGFPTSDVHAVKGGLAASFSRANRRIYWSSATGAHDVYGAVEGKYLALGGPAGTAGFPVSNTKAVPGHPGALTSAFQQNDLHIYWSATTKAHEVHGTIYQAWTARYGGPAGKLGLPISDEYGVKGGRASRFQHGTIVVKIVVIKP